MMTQKSAFRLGNKVAIIDPDEPTSEWAEFIIVYRLFNFYRLYSKSTGHRFWVTNDLKNKGSSKSDNLMALTIN